MDNVDIMPRTPREEKQMKKIPLKYRERVESVEYSPEDGYGSWWIYLKDGWVCNTSAAPHTIHENWKDALRCLRETYPEFPVYPAK